MCILFVYTGDDNDSSDFKLILASNRDEYLARPSQPASYWEEDLTIIGGRDMELGREGGTWLAASTKTARIGVILNVSGSSKPNAKGRGNIVADFLKSDLSTQEYVKQLEPYRESYNDFNFITIEIGSKSSKVHCYSNCNNNLVTASDRWLGYGNSLVESPYRKVQAGTERFRDICSQHGHEEMQDKLEEKLFDLLHWDHKHLPDEELQRRVPRSYHQLSSVFVDIAEEGYGTRAQTIVFVRNDGRMELVERKPGSTVRPFQCEVADGKIPVPIEYGSIIDLNSIPCQVALCL